MTMKELKAVMMDKEATAEFLKALKFDYEGMELDMAGMFMLMRKKKP